MNNILLILFCVLPFSSLFFRVSDVWHSQGAFFQLGILCSLTYSLYRPSDKHIDIDNKPLAFFLLWLGLVTALWWNNFLIEFKQYNFMVFMPFFNFLCFVMLYKFMIDYLRVKDLEKILRWLAVSIGLLLFYCILQRLNLDQFHKPIGMHSWQSKYEDVLMGTMGNSTHLGIYLNLCLPILYWSKLKVVNISAVFAWIIIVMTGSSSALLGAIVVTVFYFGRTKTRFILSFCGTALLILTVLYAYGWQKVIVQYLNTEGRIAFWKLLFPVFQEHSIIGAGLGKLNTLGMMNGITVSHWRHAHNIFYQLAVETGVIGVGIALWGVIKYFRLFLSMKNLALARCLAGIFLAGLITGMFNFPFHLYLTGALILFSYAGMFIVKGEEQCLH